MLTIQIRTCIIILISPFVEAYKDEAITPKFFEELFNWKTQEIE